MSALRGVRNSQGSLAAALVLAASPVALLLFRDSTAPASGAADVGLEAASQDGWQDEQALRHDGGREPPPLVLSAPHASQLLPA